jgi:hypothetical protein
MRTTDAAGALDPLTGASKNRLQHYSLVIEMILHFEMELR